MTLYFNKDLKDCPLDRDVLFLLRFRHGKYRIVQGNNSTRVISFELRPEECFDVVGWCELPLWSVGNFATDYRKTITWNWEDVKEVRKDLNREQCIQVLDEVWNNLDASQGVNYDVIRYVCEDLFGNEANEETDYSWVPVKDYKIVEGVTDAVYVQEKSTKRFTIYYKNSKPEFNYGTDYAVIETLKKYKKLKDIMKDYQNS